MGDRSRQGRVSPPEKGPDQAVLVAEPSEETLQWLGHRVPTASRSVSLLVEEQDRGIRRPSCSVGPGQALHSRGRPIYLPEAIRCLVCWPIWLGFGGRAGYYWQFLGCRSEERRGGKECRSR